MAGPSRRYPRFGRLDGRHPYRTALAEGHVDYGARRRRGSRVAYFNFGLARQMGLLPAGHPDRLNRELREAILDAFSVVIINEYDLHQGGRFPRATVLDRRYMATRYLQLQHPGRTGRTSGDGRSLWNGIVRHRGVTWDVTSCGTGVTRLCPATAIEGRFFKTGNQVADYGCGTASLEEGMAAALMSETFHRNGIATERVLAVLETSDGFAINVRAGRNLLRPSHLFLQLKQGNLRGLRAVVDYWIDRQVANGDMEPLRDPVARYRRFAADAADAFGRAAATFETEYVFCWLDWDGDNVLMDAGIIDYGSVRQFGLCHREYRFDDGGRWSTTLPEQRRKARDLVRCFAQIRDFLIDGARRPLADYRRDPVLDRFDASFAATRERRLLANTGLPTGCIERLRLGARPEIDRFRAAHRWFERSRSARGPVRVEDGLTWNAVYSTRDLLRELPSRLERSAAPPADVDVLAMALSSYATRADREPTPYRRRRARELLRAWRALVDRAARLERRSVTGLIAEIARRSAVINRFDRVTGDAAIHGAKALVRARRRLGPEGIFRAIDGLVREQELDPDREDARARPGRRDVRRVLDELVELAGELRHGL